MAADKKIRFLGNSRSVLLAFPVSARKECGVQLHIVQQGLEPEDWKPMPSVGLGVREIRVRDTSGALRVLYVTNIGDLVVVLHAFLKKSQKTAKRDLDIAASRLRDIRREQNGKSDV